MKNLLYFLPLFFIFVSCAALKPPQVTPQSSMFDRYYEACKRCFKASYGAKRIEDQGGVLIWRSDILAYAWNGISSTGEIVYCMCAIERGYHLAGQTIDGIFHSFTEEHEQSVVYNTLNKIFLYCECPVIGESELNKKIKEKQDSKINIWKNILTGLP